MAYRGGAEGAAEAISRSAAVVAKSTGPEGGATGVSAEVTAKLAGPDGGAAGLPITAAKMAQRSSSSFSLDSRSHTHLFQKYNK